MVVVMARAMERKKNKKYIQNDNCPQCLPNSISGRIGGIPSSPAHAPIDTPHAGITPRRQLYPLPTES